MSQGIAHSQQCEIATVMREDVTSMTNVEQVEARMRQLMDRSPDVEATALVRTDGLTIASVLPTDVEEDRVSAMSASMLSLGERIALELGRGELDQVYIKGKTGYVLLTAVGGNAVLTVMARSDARLGLLLLDMRRAANDLLALVTE